MNLLDAERLAKHLGIETYVKKRTGELVFRCGGAIVLQNLRRKDANRAVTALLISEQRRLGLRT